MTAVVEELGACFEEIRRPIKNPERVNLSALEQFSGRASAEGIAETIGCVVSFDFGADGWKFGVRDRNRSSRDGLPYQDRHAEFIKQHTRECNHPRRDQCRL